MDGFDKLKKMKADAAKRKTAGPGAGPERVPRVLSPVPSPVRSVSHSVVGGAAPSPSVQSVPRDIAEQSPRSLPRKRPRSDESQERDDRVANAIARAYPADVNFPRIFKRRFLHSEARRHLEGVTISDALARTLHLFGEAAGLVAHASELAADSGEMESMRGELTSAQDEVKKLRAQLLVSEERSRAFETAADENAALVAEKSRLMAGLRAEAEQNAKSAKEARAELGRALAELEEVKGELSSVRAEGESTRKALEARCAAMEEEVDNALKLSDEMVGSTFEVVMGQVKHLAPTLDWSGVSTKKFYDVKAGVIRERSPDVPEEEAPQK